MVQIFFQKLKIVFRGLKNYRKWSCERSNAFKENYFAFQQKSLFLLTTFFKHCNSETDFRNFLTNFKFFFDRNSILKIYKTILTDIRNFLKIVLDCLQKI